VALVLTVVALVPAYGLESRAAENAAAAMLATGLALVLVRRATLFAVLAFLIAENGIAVAAVSVDGALPLVVELGIAFDLVLLIAVAAVFQRRILSAFGTTDSAALRSMRG
jgi:hydrogenase-4 component E